jgi:PilZ domain
MPPHPNPRDRRTSRRNPVQVKLQISDMRGSFQARTVDVSRGGLFAATTEQRPVGSLLRIRVMGPKGDSVMAVGVVVRCFDNVESNNDGPGSPGMAIALTSTSEAWDRFWDDVNANDDEKDS